MGLKKKTSKRGDTRRNFCKKYANYADRWYKKGESVIPEQVSPTVGIAFEEYFDYRGLIYQLMD